MSNNNPYTPSFGVSPPLLVGRSNEIESFRDSLADGPGAPGRALLLTGTRGSGKTVLLNALEDVARGQGWEVVSTTVRPGFVGELTNTSLPRMLHTYSDGASRWRATGVGATAGPIGGSAQGEFVDRFPVTPSLRSELEALTDLLEGRTSGVVFSLDEVHGRARDELRELTQTVQHAFREGRPVAMVAAGLPASISDLLDDDVLTFLRRAERFTLGRVATDDVLSALREPAENFGRHYADGALELAASGTDGYPFMIQLVGHQSWIRNREAELITTADVEAGVESAARRVGRLVHEPSLRDLSDVDRTFLAAMAVDEGPSKVADIARRMEASSNYVSQYRLRLIDAEVIAPAGWGRVQFALPYLRDYLRGHVATERFER